VPKKDLSNITIDSASDKSLGTAKTFGGTQQDAAKVKSEIGPEPRGGDEPKRQGIYLYPRDIKLLKKYKGFLKKEHGNISISEIIRWAINTKDIKDFRRGY
jgi:hypothetical protein